MNRHWLNDTMLRTLLLSAGLAFGLAVGMPALAADNAASSQAHGGTVSDAAITAEVKRRFENTASLRKADIGVTTANGVVTLSGTVSDPHAKFAAAALVIQVKGVRILDDELKTRSDYMQVAEIRPVKAANRHKASDDRITSEVEVQLQAGGLIGKRKLDVTTDDGVVSLSGYLPD